MRVGGHLGNYHLLRLLGRGGFAEVYLGEHLYLKSLAALKVLHTHLNEEDTAQFMREAQLLAGLSHPHIVRVLDFAMQDGMPFLVMDYAPGGTLRQHHPAGTQLAIETIVAYVQQVASALQYAHDQRLIHRDIKPENMLLTAREDVVLTDFGLAMLAAYSRSGSTQAMEPAVAGTTAYLAPEQMQGNPRSASDQYALGVVVYEWITGKRPFTGTPIEIAMQHLSASPPLLRELRPDLSPAVEQVVLRALAKDPKDRFATVQDFAAALVKAQQPEPLPPPPLLHIGLLGEFRLVLGETAITTVDWPRLQSLLAYLLLHRTTPQARTSLAYLLWPDSTDAQAHTNLRQLLHRLRHGLPQADRFVRIEKQTLQWQPVAPWTLDVADFERGIAQADEAEQAHDQTAARQALEQAVEVYREDLLPSCYDEWILPERERLRQRFLGALDRLLLLHEQEGNYQAAISAAQRLLRHDPLQEATYRHLMRLYAASGDRAAALRTYHTCVTVLERGLAAEPSAATRAEYERLLQKEEPSPLPVAPPLLEAETAQASKSNLPVALTPLIGREHEVQAACTLLRRPEVHLLTLSGTGGVGKTRLALQVASELLNDFADGVCFVPLAPISDPHLVIATIAQTLGLKETGERALLDLLKVYLQEQHFLLVLDNFEQILEAAPRLADLLTGCPKLKMLVTSRAVLHIQGENEFALPPLAVPDLKRLPALESLSHYAAVALFLDRAKAIHPDFHLTQANAPIIAEICARLDGLPLAIELAAPRLKLLSPQGLLARLSHRLQLLTGGAANLPLRQQTMRNTIQWSYEQLSPQEQQLFRRLSVFVGDCTLEAVEALCTAFGDVSANVLDRLASLLDESLLQRVEQEGEEPRLRLLETIREFGLECLLASGELEAVQHAHATYYLWLLEEAWQNISLAEQWRWHARMEQEYDNLRAALRWSVEQGGTTGAETVLRLSLELVQFWLVSGRVSEGRSFMERALAHSEEGVTFARARGLLSAGRLAFTQDDYDQAEALLKQSQVVYRELADLVGVGATLQKLGTVALARSNYPLARRLSQEALAHFREASKSGVDDKLLMLVRVLALDNLVHIGIVQGEHSRARSLAEECLALSRQSGDRRNTATSLFHLALLAFSRGEQAVARSLVEECLTISRGIRYQGSLAFSLGLLGLMALQQDDETGAHALLAESLMIRRQVEDLWSSRWGLYCLGWVAFERWEPPMARALYEKLLSVLGQLDDTEFLTTCLEGLGSVIAAGESVENPEGKSRAGKQSREAATRWAVRLWGMAEALRKASRLPLLPHHSPLYERTITAVRTQLDEKEFAAAWAEGQTMRPQEALAALRRAEMPRPLPAPTPAGPSPVGLSAREVEVLRLVAQGLTSAQVAEQLVISPRTVNWYLTVIYSKLGVSSRSAATRYAIEHHLL